MQLVFYLQFSSNLGYNYKLLVVDLGTCCLELLIKLTFVPVFLFFCTSLALSREVLSYYIGLRVIVREEFPKEFISELQEIYYRIQIGEFRWRVYYLAQLIRQCGTRLGTSWSHCSCLLL